MDSLKFLISKLSHVLILSADAQADYTTDANISQWTICTEFPSIVLSV